MIQNWDIISGLHPDGSGNIVSTLVMDGTQDDARLVAERLKDYIRSNPAPAQAPYVYAFELPADLDEGTIEQIRILMRQGVQEATERNEIIPGGGFGNPVFDAFTLNQNAPSHAADGSSSRPAKPNPTASFGPKTIDLADAGLEIAKTLPPTPPVSDEKQPVVETPQLDGTEAHRKKWVSTQTLNKLFNTNTLNGIAQPDKSVAQDVPAQTPTTVAQDPLGKETADNASDSPKQLEDIFLAETKYDIFVDIAKDAPQNKAAAQLAKPANSPKKITPDTPTQPLPPLKPAAPEPSAFNIFDQKMKDQSSLIDIKDVADITQGIAEKDLSFVEHAQPTPSASNEPEEAEEVMDPFEQLLAGKMPQTQPEQTTPPPAAQTAVPLSAPDANTDLQQDQATITTNKETETRVNTEKTMNENQAGKKTFIHLKRKPQPPVPAAPQPPKPAAPPAPQEEKHRTLVRKNRLSKTFMDKTTTIDHSIELPLSELKKHNWPLEVPLIPTYTLENMSISINRFAHATAISVIENPGRLYNPLVLHGASGTGKTHFLHAIGYALSKKYGQENIFITNGVRLSRGIQRYIMEGNIAKFEEFTSSVKALLIDDIHLISINEQNRSHLSKLLNDFMKQQKQIVITSKYPPENLAKLEELLNFKLDSGWISDLKHAQGPARMRIIQNMLGSNGINITNEDVNRFFGHANMSLGTVVRSIRRVRVLEKLMFQNNTTQKPSAITIFDQLLATKGEDQSSLIAQKSINDIQSVSVLGNGEWGRIGFFYPQNNSNMMNWMLFALQQRAKELNIPGGPELAVRSSYSTENIISSAFKIANLCDNKKLKGAVILGPSISSCEPSVRENFYDILTHMLEIMLIRCGVINFEEAAAPSTYVKILAELLR